MSGSVHSALSEEDDDRDAAAFQEGSGGGGGEAREYAASPTALPPRHATATLAPAAPATRDPPPESGAHAGSAESVTEAGDDSKLDLMLTLMGALREDMAAAAARLSAVEADVAARPAAQAATTADGPYAVLKPPVRFDLNESAPRHHSAVPGGAGEDYEAAEEGDAGRRRAATSPPLYTAMPDDPAAAAYGRMANDAHVTARTKSRRSRDAVPLRAAGELPASTERARREPREAPLPLAGELQAAPGLARGYPAPEEKETMLRELPVGAWSGEGGAAAAPAAPSSSSARPGPGISAHADERSALRGDSAYELVSEPRRAGADEYYHADLHTAHAARVEAPGGELQRGTPSGGAAAPGGARRATVKGSRKSLSSQFMTALMSPAQRNGAGGDPGATSSSSDDGQPPPSSSESGSDSGDGGPGYPGGGPGGGARGGAGGAASGPAPAATHRARRPRHDNPFVKRVQAQLADRTLAVAVSAFPSDLAGAAKWLAAEKKTHRENTRSLVVGSGAGITKESAKDYLALLRLQHYQKNYSKLFQAGKSRVRKDVHAMFQRNADRFLHGLEGASAVGMHNVLKGLWQEMRRAALPMPHSYYLLFGDFLQYRRPVGTAFDAAVSEFVVRKNRLENLMDHMTPEERAVWGVTKLPYYDLLVMAINHELFGRFIAMELSPPITTFDDLVDSATHSPVLLGWTQAVGPSSITNHGGSYKLMAEPATPSASGASHRSRHHRAGAHPVQAAESYASAAGGAGGDPPASAPAQPSAVAVATGGFTAEALRSHALGHLRSRQQRAADNACLACGSPSHRLRDCSAGSMCAYCGQHVEHGWSQCAARLRDVPGAGSRDRFPGFVLPHMATTGAAGAQPAAWSSDRGRGSNRGRGHERGGAASRGRGRGRGARGGGNATPRGSGAMALLTSTLLPLQTRALTLPPTTVSTARASRGAARLPDALQPIDPTAAIVLTLGETGADTALAMLDGGGAQSCLMTEDYYNSLLAHPVLGREVNTYDAPVELIGIHSAEVARQHCAVRILLPEGKAAQADAQAGRPQAKRLGFVLTFIVLKSRGWGEGLAPILLGKAFTGPRFWRHALPTAVPDNSNPGGMNWGGKLTVSSNDTGKDRSMSVWWPHVQSARPVEVPLKLTGVGHDLACSSVCEMVQLLGDAGRHHHVDVLNIHGPRSKRAEGKGEEETPPGAHLPAGGAANVGLTLDAHSESDDASVSSDDDREDADEKNEDAVSCRNAGPPEEAVLESICRQLGVTSGTYVVRKKAGERRDAREARGVAGADSASLRELEGITNLAEGSVYSCQLGAREKVELHDLEDGLYKGLAPHFAKVVDNQSRVTEIQMDPDLEESLLADAHEGDGDEGKDTRDADGATGTSAALLAAVTARVRSLELEVETTDGLAAHSDVRQALSDNAQQGALFLAQFTHLPLQRSLLNLAALKELIEEHTEGKQKLNFEFRYDADNMPDFVDSDRACEPAAQRAAAHAEPEMPAVEDSAEGRLGRVSGHLLAGANPIATPVDPTSTTTAATTTLAEEESDEEVTADRLERNRIDGEWADEAEEDDADSTDEDDAAGEEDAGWTHVGNPHWEGRAKGKFGIGSSSLPAAAVSAYGTFLLQHPSAINKELQLVKAPRSRAACKATLVTALTASSDEVEQRDDRIHQKCLKILRDVMLKEGEHLGKVDMPDIVEGMSAFVEGATKWRHNQPKTRGIPGKFLDELVERLLNAGVLVESTSPVNNRLLLAVKKNADGTPKGLRLTLDMRDANRRTVLMHWNMPRAEDVFELMRRGVHVPRYATNLASVLLLASSATISRRYVTSSAVASTYDRSCHNSDC